MLESGEGGAESEEVEGLGRGREGLEDLGSLGGG